MVLIGGANYNEYGTLEGGKSGDQTGKECAIEPWYKHAKGWYVLRAKDAMVRKKIAQDMRYICENNKIGYSYWDNCYGLYNASKQYNFNASKVTTPCDTNCVKAVIVCAKYAGVNVGDCSTANEVEVFMKTGAFDLLKDSKYCDKADLLVSGDILVTRTKGHTVVVVEDGKVSKPIKWNCSTKYCGDYVVDGTANLRKFPSMESEVVTTVSNKMIVFSDGITATHEDRVWYHILLGADTEGFISGKLLKKSN